MEQKTETASPGTMLDLVDTSSQRTLQQIIQLHLAADLDTKLTLLFKQGSSKAEYMITHDDDHFVIYKFARLGTKRASLKHHKHGKIADLTEMIGPGYWKRAMNYDVMATPDRIERQEMENRVEAFVDPRCADLVAEPIDMPELDEAEELEIV